MATVLISIETVTGLSGVGIHTGKKQSDQSERVGGVQTRNADLGKSRFFTLSFQSQEEFQKSFACDHEAMLFDKPSYDNAATTLYESNTE